MWPLVGPFDGSIVSIVDEGQTSTRYFCSHSLDAFTKESCNVNNAPACVTSHPALQVGSNTLNKTFDSSVSAYTPMAADIFAPDRFVIATNTVYESKDGADSFKPLGGFSGTATRAIAYGGRKNGAENKDVLYIGSSEGLSCAPAAVLARRLSLSRLPRRDTARDLAGSRRLVFGLGCHQY